MLTDDGDVSDGVEEWEEWEVWEEWERCAWEPKRLKPSGRDVTKCGVTNTSFAHCPGKVAFVGIPIRARGVLANRDPSFPTAAMIENFLLERAALYATGALTAPERDEFELILEFHDELRGVVDDLTEVGATVAMASCGGRQPQPSPAVKSRIWRRLGSVAQEPDTDGLVMAGPDGLVRWVNEAFSEMCGYTLAELRGQKLGPLLQGEKTDPSAAERLRQAVHGCYSCRETMLNYRKSGSTYWVEIVMSPVLDDAGQPRWLVAREREIVDGERGAETLRA